MTHKKRHERDPIDEYREWVDHRYSPGYWLGRVPPSLGNLRSTRRGRLSLGWVLVAFGVLILAAAASRGNVMWSGVLLVVVPVVALGVMVLADFPRKR